MTGYPLVKHQILWRRKQVFMLLKAQSARCGGFLQGRVGRKRCNFEGVRYALHGEYATQPCVRFADRCWRLSIDVISIAEICIGRPETAAYTVLPIDPPLRTPRPYAEKSAFSSVFVAHACLVWRCWNESGGIRRRAHIAAPTVAGWSCAVGAARASCESGTCAVTAACRGTVVPGAWRSGSRASVWRAVAARSGRRAPRGASVAGTGCRFVADAACRSARRDHTERAGLRASSCWRAGHRSRSASAGNSRSCADAETLYDG